MFMIHWQRAVLCHLLYAVPSIKMEGDGEAENEKELERTPHNKHWWRSRRRHRRRGGEAGQKDRVWMISES